MTKFEKNKQFCDDMSAPNLIIVEFQIDFEKYLKSDFTTNTIITD